MNAEARTERVSTIPTYAASEWWLTTNEAASKLRVSRWQMRVLLRNGRIPGAQRFGTRTWRVPLSVVARIIEGSLVI